MLTLFKAIWRRWKGFAHRLISAQNWFLMCLVYWGSVAPIAILMKTFAKPLLDRGLGPDDASSFWIDRDDGPMTMEQASHMS